VAVEVEIIISGKGLAIVAGREEWGVISHGPVEAQG